MSKAVLIAIRPEWCAKIASGEKTIEVRKTRPKMPAPFKCYIYCARGEYLWLAQSGNVMTDKAYNRILDDLPVLLNGKVIGEFVCDGAIPMSIKYSNPDSYLALKEFPYTCMTDKQIINYLGNGGDGYGWHISELKIYDRPKELCEFYRREKVPHGAICAEDTFLAPIYSPPQSWCYVEELI